MIDVVIPVYNGERYIEAALCSVLRQSYRPQRIVVVDDGSTDHTGDVVRRVKETSSMEILYIPKAHGGVNSARNVGLTHASCPWVAFLDADDVWLEDKLKVQRNLIERTSLKNLGVVYGGYSLIDASGQDIIGVRTQSPKLRGRIYKSLLSGNYITGSASTVLIKRSCFDEVGRFDENLHAGEDWDMWLRIAEKFEYDFSTKTLTKIRVHGCSAQSNKLQLFIQMISFYEKWNLRIEGVCHCPNSWAGSIAWKIIEDLPGFTLLEAVKQRFSPTAQRRIFRLTFGSLRLYLSAALLLHCLWEMTKAIKRCLLGLSTIIQYPRRTNR
jgi:glycosyltransferase involved in cell wall biosynthesis